MTSEAYKRAGVDIDAGNQLVEKLKPLAKQATRPEVLSGLGGFGGCFELDVGRYRQPVLISGADGVGTKLKLACQWQKHDNIGIDLVAMCANDILTCGAEPLFFLDYYATSQLDVRTAEAVIAGISRGCQQAGMALLGGETAEMPGLYSHGDYDLAGFCVGVVEKDSIIDGSQIQPGHAVIGLASTGIHSNGYSLVRQLLIDYDIIVDQKIGSASLRDLLLEPTQIYVNIIQTLLQDISILGMAHITGGGLLENIPRMLPSFTSAKINVNSWPMTPLFEWLYQTATLSFSESYTVFNAGIGYVLCIPAEQVEKCLNICQNLHQKAWLIGQIEANQSSQPTVTLVKS